VEQRNQGEQVFILVFILYPFLRKNGNDVLKTQGLKGIKPE
jgi:hypothetical protein